MISFVIGVFIGIIVGVNGGDQQTAAIFGGIAGFFVGTIGGWLYYALQYASRFQANLGMRCFGIQVVDYNYQRISFGRATDRFFAKIISGLTLGIGFLMIAFTERKQGLHDFMAGTYMVYKD
ncbi:MAG: RDD family protein [Pseudomonadota bacterium]